MFTSILRRGFVVGLVFASFSVMIPNVYAEQKSETSMTVELTRKIEPGSEPGSEQPEQPEQPEQTKKPEQSNQQNQPNQSEQVSKGHTIKTSQQLKYNKLLPQLGATSTNLLGIGLLLVILVLVKISTKRIDKMYKNEEK